MAPPRSSIKRAAPARTSTTTLLCLLLASSRICRAFTNDFTSYPAGSQACLDKAAAASQCDGQTSQAMNKCLCSNRGNFIYASARCIARESRGDLDIVYETMENNCAGTQTYINVGKPAWDTTAEAALAEPAPPTTTTTGRPPTTTGPTASTTTTATSTTATTATTTAAAAGAPTSTGGGGGSPSILDDMSTGTKVGLFVGVVFGALALMLASIFLWLYGRRRRRDHGPYGHHGGGGKSPDPSEMPPGFHHQQLQSETELSSMYYKPTPAQPSPLGPHHQHHPAAGYWEPQHPKQQPQYYAPAPPYVHQQQQQPFIAELDDGAGMVHELPGESAKRHYAELPSQPPPASLPQSPTAPPQSPGLPFPPSPYTSTFGSQLDGAGTNVSLDSRYR